MQVVIYARISRDREGAGLGIERQRQDCEQLAAQLGWTVVGVFGDNDISAYSGRSRPGYDAMCEALDSGAAQAVIAWHTDRLHRRPVELEAFIDLCDRRGVEVRTVRAGGLDLSSASGQMIARMLGAAARHEVDHAIERQRAAKLQAAQAGKFRGGRRAFGYEANGMATRPDEAAAIRQACGDVVAGISLSQVARDWNAAGLRTAYGGKEFTSREVRKILMRPRNAGISLHEGKPIATGQWEPIVDSDTHAAVCAVLRANSSHASHQRKHQGSGVYLCSKCGATMVGAAHNRGPDGRYRSVYSCSRTRHLARDVEHLDRFVDDVVIGVLSRPDANLRLGTDLDISELRTRETGLRARLDALATMFATGEINGDQLRAGSAELQSQLDAISASIASARASNALANIVLSGDDLRETWSQTPPEVRGRVISELMTVTVLPARLGRKPGGAYFDPHAVRIDWHRDDGD